MGNKFYEYGNKQCTVKGISILGFYDRTVSLITNSTHELFDMSVKST